MEACPEMEDKSPRNRLTNRSKREVEKIIRDLGAVPATIAILSGKVCIGLGIGFGAGFGAEGSKLNIKKLT